MSAQPRLVVSAPSSGHGKTAIAVGLLAAAAARGVQAAGFKVGPDHTDAAYLGLAAGRPGRNLDPRLVGAQRIAPLFAHGASGAQLSVIEGAMGLFDSLTGQPELDGTAAVAATLRAPVVLVVDVAAMGHSLAALVHGFRMFDEMVHLGGVILNRVASPRHEQMLRTALDDIGMPVLGALRRGDLPNVLPARAHGPVPVAHRTVEASRAVRRLGEAVAGGLDLERLMALAGSAPALPGPIWTPSEAVGGEGFDQRPLVALAGGAGAPYTYVETAELLTAAGADVAVVDPLRDESLPAGTRALIVGAGLPEGYAEELSANRRLCNAVAKFAHDGWPVVAEGVALPWLGRDFDGRPMCAVLDASAITGDQTVAGYREATAPTTSPLAPAGARITGYKQHRAIVTPRAGAVPAWTWSGGNPEGFVWRQVHASQLGLHWAAAPEIAKRVVAAAIAGPGGVPGQQPGPIPHGQPVPVPPPGPYGPPVVISGVPFVANDARPTGHTQPLPVASGVPHLQPAGPVASGVPHAPAGSPSMQGGPHGSPGQYGQPGSPVLPHPQQMPHGQAGPPGPHAPFFGPGPHESGAIPHEAAGLPGAHPPQPYGQGGPVPVSHGQSGPGSLGQGGPGSHGQSGPGSLGQSGSGPLGQPGGPGPHSPYGPAPHGHSAGSMPIAGGQPPAMNTPGGTSEREIPGFEARGLADTADITAS